MKKPDNSVMERMKKIFLRSKKKQPQKQEEHKPWLIKDKYIDAIHKHSQVYIFKHKDEKISRIDREWREK